MTAATAEGDMIIPFEPKDQDVIATSLRSWNSKHPGTLAHAQLIHEHAQLLPPSQAVDHGARLLELATRIVDIITVERQGRFLKLDYMDEKQNQCVVMDHQAIIHKVKTGLVRQQKRLCKSSPTAKSKAASSFGETTTVSPPSNNNGNLQQCDFYSYPCFVYNKRKAQREIEEFVASLTNAKRCVCNNNWCVLNRPHYLFSNSSTQSHLIETIAAYHSQEQWGRSTSLSQWFVKANKYRFVMTLQGDTIHLCKNSLCRILGLTDSAIKDVDRDQRILIFMKRQAQQEEKSKKGKKKSAEENYQEFTSLDSENDSAVSPDYFRNFWEINQHVVLAGIWVERNSRRSMMDNVMDADADLDARGSKRLRKQTTAAPANNKPIQTTKEKTAAATARPTKKPRVGKEATSIPAVIIEPTKKAARRVSVGEEDDDSRKTSAQWRCSNCFHENHQPPPAQPQRPSIASLNRKHRIQKRKARFIRRGALHPVSKLSRL